MEAKAPLPEYFCFRQVGLDIRVYATVKGEEVLLYWESYGFPQHMVTTAEACQNSIDRGVWIVD